MASPPSSSPMAPPLCLGAAPSMVKATSSNSFPCAEVMVATGTFATSFRTKDPRWSCSPRHRLVSASNLAYPRTLGENIDLALL
ncbi:hypothetical protein U9M48_034610 [Paspalum notatum var. saurae]|uniref:Uncharacterized protein n=1 Tax=Paspalum notatum var. saurae TaxID=547442 RepID=A0AAQ3UDV3_PASNO